MRGTLRKILSLLLTLAIVNGMTQAATITAMADDITETYDDSLTASYETESEDSLIIGGGEIPDDALPVVDGESGTNGDSPEADLEPEEVSAAMAKDGKETPTINPGDFPYRFDLRDIGRVTPVKMQAPWGSCWAFSATAAAETSILTAMDSTYAETGLDLSERHLAWYVAQPVTENISNSQAGESLHLYDENPNNIYEFGGKDTCAGTLYAQGIGPVPESEYPYRGVEGNLTYDMILANRDAIIEKKMSSYKKTYPDASEDELRSKAEQYFERYLAKYEIYDYYSEDDDWTISEPDEPGSGRLRGAPYTLLDNNTFIYWVADHYEGIDTFGQEPLFTGSMGESGTRLLYQESIDQIKSELYAGRGVSVGIKLSDDSLNEETWAQYFDGNAVSTNHAVCIVGWDDDYAASNFNYEPPGNGAWIVKNSWGSQTDIIPGGLVARDGTTKDANGRDWGIVDENGLHTGYFYLSYYDEGITAPESFVFDLRENHDQENALQLDYMPSAANEWIYKDENPTWIANVFTLDKDMRIDEVATRFMTGDEVPLTGFSLTFDIYRLRDGATAPDDGELLASCTREVSKSGYHRVELDAPVYSRAGDRLSVVVRQHHNYEDGSAKYFVTAQASLKYKDNPQLRRDPLYGTSVVNEGESFLKIENVTETDEAATEGWIDLCAPFSEDFFKYIIIDNVESEHMAEWYASRYIGKPIKDFYHNDNFGIKAFGEPFTLEHMEAASPSCEEAGNIEYWVDPETGVTFADENGVTQIESVEIEATGHDWDEGKVTIEPSTEKPGEIIYTCRKCDATKTEEIPKKTISIEKASVGGVSLSYGYSGKAYEPAVTVKVNGKILEEGIDYTVRYADNTKPGTATITITGIGEYTGTRIKTFEIVDCASKIADGKTYLLIPKNNSATAVCSFSGRMVNNTKVYITDRTGSEAMRFKAVKNPDGTWKFINAKCELALAVQQNSSEIGKGLVLYDQTTRKAQNWKLTKKSDNSWAIMNAVTGYSIAMSDSSAKKGTTLSMAETKSDGLQRFYIVETTPVKAPFDGTKSVRASKDKNYAVNIVSSSKEEGANVNLYSYSNVNAKKFRIMYSGGGYYRLVNVNSGLILTVRGNTKTDGANVIQSKWAAQSGQRWKITGNANGTVTLTNALGTNLHLSGNKTANGTNVIAKNASASTAQKWYLQ